MVFNSVGFISPTSSSILLNFFINFFLHPQNKFSNYWSSVHGIVLVNSINSFFTIWSRGYSKIISQIVECEHEVPLHIIRASFLFKMCIKVGMHVAYHGIVVNFWKANGSPNSNSFCYNCNFSLYSFPLFYQPCIPIQCTHNHWCLPCVHFNQSSR
jgi:hypothetical protein